VEHAYERIPGVSEIRRALISPVECEYVQDGEHVIARLASTLNSVSVEPLSSLALKFAKAFQERYGSPMQIFDESYSFHCPLDASTSAEALELQVFGEPADSADGPTR
jgi:hypothetical protein